MFYFWSSSPFDGTSLAEWWNGIYANLEIWDHFPIGHQSWKPTVVDNPEYWEVPWWSASQIPCVEQHVEQIGIPSISIQHSHGILIHCSHCVLVYCHSSPSFACGVPPLCMYRCSPYKTSILLLHQSHLYYCGIYRVVSKAAKSAWDKTFLWNGFFLEWMAVETANLCDRARG